MGGDQDVEFAGLIRRVKASSLAKVREMKEVCVQSSEDLPSELVTLPEQFRSSHWRWRGRVQVMEGFVGRKRRGDGGGGENELFVLSMPSPPGSAFH
jgi:hypothetical protein